jgi:predicted dehydrogenase
MRLLADKLTIGPPQAVYITGGAAGLVTNGIHHIDWIVELFGEWPELVTSSARGEKINPRSPKLQFYEGTAAWIFPSGREATISFSNRSSVAPNVKIYYRDAIAELGGNLEIEINLRDEASIKKHPTVTRTGTATFLGQRGQIPGVLKLEQATSLLLDEIDLDLVKVFTPYDAQLALGACIGALTSGLTHRAINLPIDPESEDGTREWPIS